MTLEQKARQMQAQQIVKTIQRNHIDGICTVCRESCESYIESVLEQAFRKGIRQERQEWLDRTPTQ